MSEIYMKVFGAPYSDVNIVLKEYSVTEEMMEDSIKMLKQWFKMQPHLCNIKLDDETLRRFLLSSNYRMELTKIGLESYYSKRQLFPEIFTNRDPCSEKISKAMNKMSWFMMAKKTPENLRISILRLQDDDPESFDEIMLMKLGFMNGDVRMKHDSHSGEILIADFTNLTIGHIIKLVPTFKRSFYIMQDCYKLKIKQIHLIGLPNYALSIMAALKAVLKDKVFKRIVCHQHESGLHEYISKELLPEDLGGTQKSLSGINDDWKQFLQTDEVRNWLISSEKNVADLSKKPIDDSNCDDRLGITGSFRKLCVD